MAKGINRIKVVLAEKGKTNLWLAQQLNCSPATVSKWCTNNSQPSMETFMKLAKLLDTNLTSLVRIDEE